jgi:hypothetical protein
VATAVVTGDCSRLSHKPEIDVGKNLASLDQRAEAPRAYETNGANLQFTEPTPAGSKHWRLHK